METRCLVRRWLLLGFAFLIVVTPAVRVEAQEPVPQDHYDPDDAKTWADVVTEDRAVAVRGQQFNVHFYRPQKDGSPRLAIYACGDGGWVGIIDLTAQHFTPAFAAACVDGLLWDPTDNTFWAGGDDAPTIEHYTADGTLISSTDIHEMIGGCGRTGIEAVGGKLLIGNPSCGIYALTRTLSSATLFVTPSPVFVEDMACDSRTFAKTLNKTALWVVHPYDTEVVGYEAAPKGSGRPPCK